MPDERPIPRPDITVAQIILLGLAQRGRLAFSDIISSPMAKLLGVERTENSFYTALSRLKRRKFVVRTSDRMYELTPTGEYAALKAYVRKEFTELERKLATRNSQLATSPKWDGRWRLVLFDVPESRRPIRDYIRSVLRRIGCREFQRSLWIYPHKLPLFILRMFDDPQIRQFARVITTSDIDYDEDLRKSFRLA
jgi:DNA-binding transcriptional regulator PaaX